MYYLCHQVIEGKALSLVPDPRETHGTSSPFLPLPSSWVVGSLDLFDQLLLAGKVCGEA